MILYIWSCLYVGQIVPNTVAPGQGGKQRIKYAEAPSPGPTCLLIGRSSLNLPEGVCGWDGSDWQLHFLSSLFPLPFLTSVLIRVTAAVMKHCGQKQVGEERVDLACASTLLFISKGSQDRSSNRAGTWKQELMQRPQRGAAYLLASHGLLRLLSHRTRDHQLRDGTTHNGLGPSYQSLIKKMSHRWILLRHLLNWGSFLSDNF